MAIKTLQKLNTLHYKDLFLYGFYGSYIVITAIAAAVDATIGSYFDALIDLLSVGIALSAFLYYLHRKDREQASIMLFWIASAVIFMFVIHNGFDISIIFTLLIPMVAFILLPTQKMIIHVGNYFLILSAIFAYGYSQHETHALLYNIRNMSAYFIALLFVLAFGAFYHIAIERSYVELENANRQKTFLLKEVHHRVKNNLNLIASILGIQKLESGSKETRDLIEQNKLRIESLAMAHEMLYVQEDLANIAFKDYITKLAKHILHTNDKDNTVDLHIDMCALTMDMERMIQFGIVINELITNSIKYAFDGQQGCISMQLYRQNDIYVFWYKDNEKGAELSPDKKGFGTRLVEMSVAQLEGDMQIENNNGLHYRIIFDPQILKKDEYAHEYIDR